MTLLSDLMRKRAIATATVATPATQEGMEGLTVAKVASVAVANRLFPEEESVIRARMAVPGFTGIFVMRVKSAAFIVWRRLCERRGLEPK